MYDLLEHFTLNILRNELRTNAIETQSDNQTSESLLVKKSILLFNLTTLVIIRLS